MFSFLGAKRPRATSSGVSESPGGFSTLWDFPGGAMVKNLPSNAGDAGLIPDRGPRALMPWGN